LSLENDPTPTGAEQKTEELSAEEQIALKVNAAQAADFQSFDEDTGEIVPNAPPEAPVVAAPEPEIPEDAPVAEPPKPTRKVKVYGQEEEVDVEALIERGIRDFQKESAADKKLQAAVLRERQAEERLANLQQQLPTGAAQPEPAPSQDAPQNEDQIAAAIRREIYNAKAEDAALTFAEEFPDIAADPFLRSMAAQLEDQRLRELDALREPLGSPVVAYRKHGEAVRAWVKRVSAPAAPAAPAVNPDKLERKQTITAVPAASARPPAPKEDKPPTMSEIIEQERKARLGRPIQSRSH
jgi:hypothetical protein